MRKGIYCSENQERRIPWNKGLKTGPLSEETKRKIRNKLKGHKAWNKGIPHSDEKIQKLRDKQKGEKGFWYGKHLSLETIQKLREKKIGENNPMFGRTDEKSPLFGNHHSEETIQKMREKRIQYFQTHCGPFKDTKPELKMEEILNFLHIPYEKQFRAGNHLVDFHFLNTNILAEVDGDYWHGNSQIFPKLSKRQLNQKQKDLKNERLAKELGYIVLRFWESDILKNENIVRNKLMEVING